MDSSDRAALLAELEAELVRLRKGGGVYSARLQQRLGPNLRELLDYTPGMDEAVVRPELTRLLDTATAPLSPSMRRAALIALAVAPSLAEKNLIERLDLIAEEIQRNRRTAQRRVDDAATVMAGVLADQLARTRQRNTFVPPGWSVESLHSRLSFAGPRPTLVERREIVAVEPGLSSIAASLSLLVPPVAVTHGLEVTAIEGCTVDQVVEVTPRYWKVTLGLPAPLPVGARHHYEVAFTAPHRDSMEPVYGFVPFRPSRRFTAEILFADADDVESIWALDGVPQTILSETEPSGPLLTIGPDHTVRCAHDNLVQGLCFGVQWRWRTASAQAANRVVDLDKDEGAVATTGSVPSGA